MSPPKSVEKMSPEEMRAELVSLLADGVLRYLAKRRVDRGHRQPQFSAESVEGALEVSSKSGLSVTNPVNGLCSLTTLVIGYELTYDANSRIISINSHVDGLISYTYDNTHQLTASRIPPRCRSTRASMWLG